MESRTKSTPSNHLKGLSIIRYTEVLPGTRFFAALREPWLWRLVSVFFAERPLPLTEKQASELGSFSKQVQNLSKNVHFSQETVIFQCSKFPSGQRAACAEQLITLSVRLFFAPQALFCSKTESNTQSKNKSYGRSCALQSLQSLGSTVAPESLKPEPYLVVSISWGIPI